MSAERKRVCARMTTDSAKKIKRANWDKLLLKDLKRQGLDGKIAVNKTAVWLGYAQQSGHMLFCCVC